MELPWPQIIAELDGVIRRSRSARSVGGDRELLHDWRQMALRSLLEAMSGSQNEIVVRWARVGDGGLRDALSKPAERARLLRVVAAATEADFRRMVRGARLTRGEHGRAGPLDELAAASGQTADPSVGLRVEELRSLIEKGRMSELERELVRGILEGRTLSSIAEAQGVSKATVTRRLASLLGTLKRALGE